MTLRIILLCSLVLAYPSQAQVYKWKDKNGITQYSDTPPANIKVEELQKSSSAPKQTVTETKLGSEKPKSLDKDAQKRSKDADDLKKSDEVKEAERKVKEANCSAAKTNYNTYKQGGRIVTVDENGNRKFYNSDEINSGLEDAKEKMEKYCD